MSATSSFNIVIRKPLSAANGAGTMVNDRAGSLMIGYSHSINDSAGFDSAQIILGDNPANLLDWLNYWGHHIEIVGDAGTIWEGFVNRVIVDNGGASISTSPFKEMVNKVNITYTSLSWNTNPPIGGDARDTGFNTEDNSIDLYGTMEAIINAGTAEDTAALQSRALYLKEFSYRQISHELSFTGQPGVTLECLGYYHLLEKYLYTQTASVVLVNASDKIIAVLAAQPQSLFGTSSFPGIEDNTTQIDGYAEGKDTAAKVIKDAVSSSDSSNRHWLFGIYEGRRAIYRPVLETAWDYVYYMFDPSASYYDLGGTPIEGYTIRPGTWIKIDDMSISDLSATPNRTGGPFVYVKSVTYTAPNSVQISGDRISKFNAKIASLGVGAIT